MARPNDSGFFQNFPPKNPVPPDVAAMMSGDKAYGTNAAAQATSGDVPAGRGARPAMVLFPPDYYPIPGATYFSLTDTETVTGPTATLVPAALTLLLPPQARGVIRMVEVGINNTTVLTNAGWRIRFDEAVQAGATYQIISRTASYAGFARDCFLRIAEGVTKVDIQFFVVDAAAYVMGFTYEGWFWTLQQEAEYFGTARGR